MNKKWNRIVAAILLLLSVPFSNYASQTRVLNAGQIDGISSELNHLENEGFEKGLNDWISSDATVTEETVNYVRGSKAAKISMSSQTGMLYQNVNPHGLAEGIELEASCKVKTSLTNIRLCSLVNNVEQQCIDVPSTNYYFNVISTLTGPSSGNIGVKVKADSNATGVVYVDDCFIGFPKSLKGIDAATTADYYRGDKSFQTLDTSVVPENGNLYYTAARFNSALSAKSTSDVSEGSNLYYTSARANSDFDTRLATKSTSNLSEGSNLYYTDVRATNAAVAAISASSPLTYSSGVVGCQTASGSQAGCLSSSSFTTFNAKEPAITAGTNLQYYRGDKTFQTLNTTAVPEGSNLYYTNARVDTEFDTRLATKSTSNLAEGSNLYFTNARVDSEFDVRLATKTTSNLTEGSNLYYTNARGIGSTLTGFSAGAGVVSSSDSILQSIQKIVGNVSALVTGVSSVFGRTGAVVATAGDYTSAQITEVTNLFFTNARAIAATLTSFASTTGTVTSSDSILTALQKIVGNLALKYGSVTYTPSTPTRTLNTNFTPSATLAVQACYSLNLSCTLTIAGTCSGTVELRSDTNATPTTVRGTIGNTLTLGVGVVVSTTTGGPQQICYLVPPGHNVRLVSSGTITPTFVSQSEVSVAFGP